MKKLTTLLIISLIYWNNLLAGHLWGADINYKSLGNGNYLVTYNFYRDCAGVPSPISLILNVDNVCGFAPATYTMPAITNQSLLPACFGQSTCNNGILQGIEKWVYQVTITLPDTCSLWTLSVSQPTRNPGITIFQDPQLNNLYIEASINNTELTDTSTVFLNDPVVQVCANQPACIDPGLFDTEGNSMVAYFIVPKSDPNTMMIYKSGYSLLYPMNLNSPLDIDPETGIFCFNALANDYSQYAIEVASYRNGKFLGKIQRDVGLTVVSCAPEQPSLSGINGYFSVDTFACAGNNLCFHINSTGYSPTDSTMLLWDHNIPAATFSKTPGQNEGGDFCWQTSLSDINPTPYCFTVNVRDNRCVASRSDSKTYCVTVYDSAGCILAGLKEQKSEYEFEIYPQPAKEYVTIRLIQKKNINLKISDALGKTVYKRTINSENELTIPLNNLSPGVYLISIESKDHLILNSKKLIKVSSKY